MEYTELLKEELADAYRRKQENSGCGAQKELDRQIRQIQRDISMSDRPASAKVTQL